MSLKFLLLWKNEFTSFVINSSYNSMALLSCVLFKPNFWYKTIQSDRIKLRIILRFVCDLILLEMRPSLSLFTLKNIDELFFRLWRDKLNWIIKKWSWILFYIWVAASARHGRNKHTHTLKRATGKFGRFEFTLCTVLSFGPHNKHAHLKNAASASNERCERTTTKRKWQQCISVLVRARPFFSSNFFSNLCMRISADYLKENNISVEYVLCERAWWVKREEERKNRKRVVEMKCALNLVEFVGNRFRRFGCALVLYARSLAYFYISLLLRTKILSLIIGCRFHFNIVCYDNRRDYIRLSWAKLCMYGKSCPCIFLGKKNYTDSSKRDKILLQLVPLF